MDEQNKGQLQIDPSVINSKNTKQNTESIDSKYGVSLFRDEKQEYSIYTYPNTRKYIYSDRKEHVIDINTDKLTPLYTIPEVYPVSTGEFNSEYTNLLIVTIIIQAIVVSYFIVRIITVRSKQK